MATETDDKVEKARHPVLPVYFNKSNLDVHQELIAKVDKGLLSAWVIEAIKDRLRSQGVIEVLDSYMQRHSIAPASVPELTSPGTAAAPELSDNSDGWD